MLTLYHYPNCSTCRNARKWLSGNGLDPTLIDLVATPPSAATLRDLHARSGLPLRRFFNTSGQSYRGGGFKDRLPTMSEDEQFAALAADGKLVKRPIIDDGTTVLVGFREEEWAGAFG